MSRSMSRLLTASIRRLAWLPSGGQRISSGRHVQDPILISRSSPRLGALSRRSVRFGRSRLVCALPRTDAMARSMPDRDRPDLKRGRTDDLVPRRIAYGRVSDIVWRVGVRAGWHGLACSGRRSPSAQDLDLQLYVGTISLCPPRSVVGCWQESYGQVVGSCRKLV